MALRKGFFAAAVSSVALFLPSTAWAAYDQALILEGPGGAAIETAQLTFVTDTGASVPVTYYDEDDEDFDGVFVIEFPGDQAESGTLTYPALGGASRTARIAAAPDGHAVTVNVGTGAVTSAPSPFLDFRLNFPKYFSTPYAQGDVSWTQLDLPETTFGVGDIGGSEYTLLGTETRFNYATYGGTVGFPLGKLMLSGSYFTGKSDGATSATLAAGGDTRGIVFIGDSSEFGTGLGLGTVELGVDSYTNFDFDYGKIRLALPLPIKSGKGVFQPNLSLSYGEYDLSHYAEYTVPAYSGDVWSGVEEHYQLDRWGVGLGMTYYHPLCEKFFIGLGGDLTVNFNDRQFDAFQDIEVFANSDTVSISDNRNDTSLGLLGEVSGTYLITPKIGLTAFGRISYDDDFGRIFNPLSGNDILAGDTARIENADVTTYSLGGRLDFRF
jgi:hypothetical protein